MSDYKIHPVCDEVPPMSSDEFDELVASMKQFGFDSRFPIVLHDGMILDGRHRYAAGLEAGVAMEFVDWNPGDDDTPDDFVHRSNSRRNMTPAQRAAWKAARMERIEREAKERGLLGKRHPEHDLCSGSKRAPQSDHMAAKEAGVSRDAIQVAKKAKNEAPEVYNRMRRGEVSVEGAKREIKEKQRGPKFHQPEKPSSGPKKPDPVKDLAGRMATEYKVIRALEKGSRLTELWKAIQSLKRDIAKAGDDEMLGAELRTQQVVRDMENAANAVRFAMPYTTCPYPIDQCRTNKCKACKGRRWIVKEVWDRISDTVKMREKQREEAA